MKHILIAAALALAGATAIPAQAGPQVDFQIVIGNAPPPPRYEVVPPAPPQRIWVPGYWAWTGRQHVWIAGHWEQALPGHSFHASKWHRVYNGWHYERGGWERDRRHDRKLDGRAGRRDDRHKRFDRHDRYERHESHQRFDVRKDGPRHR